MFASGLDCVNYQLDQIINNSYIRIQSQLKIASTEMTIQHTKISSV
ncbi:MAG: hypothetical protein PG981_000772 [Wolbachia endosymbiont of Ctenocephalides orientis wCori]|nr:MAG: hypothetical protein PG981_000294 [Wolbachia endosymbiont of Ctenocephalides orientis wCori]WCR53750.1 MAG: hypothetical protein PG981_000772 [Wolbachia endosymbiont of Ctenocephalides orientis wCori]